MDTGFVDGDGDFGWGVVLGFVEGVDGLEDVRDER